MLHKAKISPKNKVFLKKIKDLKKEYGLIGIIDIGGLPAKQFQMIRSSISNYSKILIVKKKLMKLAFKELDSTCKNISTLLEGKNGILGLIFMNDNPFKICKIIEKNKSFTNIKAGEIVNNEIIVPEGPTGFVPGPILGELGSVGIKVGVVDGKIEVKEDCVVAKEGDTIKPVLAAMLSRLGIEPVQVGLNVLSIWENGILYDKKVLFIDENKFMDDLKSVITRTTNLSIGLGFFTKETISYAIRKDRKRALSLAKGIKYICSETIKDSLISANNEANALNGVIK